jgi:predicted O-methyltransferase YrrM
MTKNTFEDNVADIPAVAYAILSDTQRIGFTMACEPRTGSLLRTLAACKPGGSLLELGTGTGFGTAWILAGMDRSAHLDSVESDGRVLDVAIKHLAHDKRVTFHHVDGVEFLANPPSKKYDFIYADTWPGKYTHLDVALSLLAVGGIYFVDDLLPQPSWPENHANRIAELVAALERRREFVVTKLAWASGLMILIRTKAA